MAMRLRDLPDGHPVAVDTETSGKHWDDGATVSIVSYAFRCPETQELVSGALPFDQGHHGKELPPRHEKRLSKWDEWAREEVAPNLPGHRYVELLRIFQRFNLIYHNAKYDQHMLRTGVRGYPGFCLLEQFCADTFLGQNVLDSQFPLALKANAVRLALLDGGEDAEAEALKPWLGPKTDARFDLVPWSIIGPYADTDAVLTFLLWEIQQERFASEEESWLSHFLRTDYRLMKCLYWMEMRGIQYDDATSLEMAELLETEQQRVADRFPFKATPPGAKKFFFLPDPECVWCEGEGNCAACSRPPYKGKKTASCLKDHEPECTLHPQLDTEVQELLVQDGVEWAPEYLYHENLKAARTKWYEPWGRSIGNDGRLRGNFKQASVVTERLSADRVNLLAIPKDSHMPPVEGLVTVRKLFSPKPGYSLWSIDLGQAEVRVGAHISECWGLYSGFLDGVDAHSRACQLMFGLDLDDPKWKLMRGVSKTINLSIQYAAGEAKVHAQIEKDTKTKFKRSQVRDFRNKWRESFPEMVQAIRQSAEQVEKYGYIRMWNKRIRWFDHERGGRPEPSYSAFNARCQGGVAEIMKLIMWDWEQKHPGTMLIQTHDALLIETPTELGETLAIEASNLMVDHCERAMSGTWKSTGEFVKFPFTAEWKEWKDDG